MSRLKIPDTIFVISYAVCILFSFVAHTKSLSAYKLVT
jgi:hypothetical protein